MVKLSPVLAWKTRVASLRNIEAGEAVGYNATFRAYRPTRLALLPIGYGDGLSRLLSNRGSVLIRGQRAPIAGRVSMDQTILDVTDISDVKIGDEAVILGEQGSESDYCVGDGRPGWNHPLRGAVQHRGSRAEGRGRLN